MDIHIKKITIEYEYNNALYRLTLPERTKADAIILDRHLAAMVRGLRTRDDEDRRALIRAGVHPDMGSAAIDEFVSEWMPREPQDHWLTVISPDGSDWDGHTEGMARIVDSLEKVPGVVWAHSHCRTDLCIHDEACMWFCMQHT